MYTRCLWCTADLGRNEVLESFPVGRRLAFDQAKGRLWVVCKQCERWNLTPVEERWEAIESCERLYRDARQRVATEQIGLAKLREGLELVRIGTPLRPEFAAWRYGDQFGRRRQRALALGAAGVAVAGAAYAGLAWLGGAVFFNGMFLQWGKEGFLRTRTATTLDLAGETRRVSMLLADRTRIVRGAFSLRLAVPLVTSATKEGVESRRADDGIFGSKVKYGVQMPDTDAANWAIVSGVEARAYLARLLPAVNRAGGKAKVVAEAVQRSEQIDGDRATAALRALGSRAHQLGDIDVATRLMLEMALHEDDERRWMEGELAELESRWQEAESLAGIAERLTDR